MLQWYGGFQELCDQGAGSISLHFPWYILIFRHGNEVAAPTNWDSVSRFRVPMGGIDVANDKKKKKKQPLCEKEIFSGK